MSNRWTLSCLGCFLLAASLGTRSAGAQCLDWKDGFGPPVVGTDSRVYAQIAFDDGTGPALYLGGSFLSAGGVTAYETVRWNGSSWSAVGGASAPVRAFTVFDDGNGPRLYRAGQFTKVDRWTGTGWSSLPGQFPLSSEAYALASFDDGTGPALYVAGSFAFVNGVAASRIARWNGTDWSAVGSGLDASAMAFALAVFDDGTGPALYVGGSIATAGGIAAVNVAKWNGSTWSALGSGVGSYVTTLGVFDDGGGPALYAGGPFTQAGGQPADHVAKWNGSSWSALNGGGTNNTVDSLQVWNDGGGSALFVGGKFTTAGGQPANRVARWDGSSWQALGNGLTGGGTVDNYSFAVFDDGAGEALYASGEFTTAGSVSASNIARWNASSWSSVGPPGAGINGDVYALKAHDDGSGPSLFVGGQFTNAGGVAATSLAKWNGTSWSSAGAAFTGGMHFVAALELFDAGSGPELYAGGSFIHPAAVLARWNGTTWSSVGGGLSNVVYALTTFSGGGGPALYAGGLFTTAGSNPANFIARYDGTSWSALGSGMDGVVYALAVFDDGSGPALYAGGNFTTAGGVPANKIAKWDGASWSALGSGLTGGSLPLCYALTVHDDGSGPALFVGGYFATAGGVPANSIAKWDGTSWSTLNVGLNSDVRAFAITDDGTGPALYAAGTFTFSGSVLVRHIARWDGSAWSALGYGADDVVRALGVFDDGSGGGPDLYLGGQFGYAGTQVSSHFAETRGCAGPGTLFCYGDGASGACPCNNSGLIAHGCQNSIATGGAQLYSSGTAVPDTVVLHASGELPTALSIFLQGNAQIAPVSFGDGLRCAGGALKRLYNKSASGGNVAAPQAGDPSITARSLALGDPIAHGTTRYYQTYYRDPNLSYCPAPFGDSWNVTNGVKVAW